MFPVQNDGTMFSHRILEHEVVSSYPRGNISRKSHMSFVSQTSEVNWVAMDFREEGVDGEILASGLYGSKNIDNKP